MKTSFRYVHSKAQGDLERFAKHDYLSKKELGVRKIVRGMIVPGPAGGVAQEGSFVEGSMSYTVRCRNPKYWNIPPVDQVKEVDEEVLYLGSFEGCWGHCITDNFNKLWIVESPLVEQYKNKRWVYIVDDSSKELPSNFAACLRKIGIPLENLVRIIEPTLFRAVYLPDECFYSDPVTTYRYYTREYEKLIEKCTEISHNPTRRVYLSRSGWRNNKVDFGEHNVIKVFEELGYEIVTPQGLSFDETVRLMGECKVLASTEGSCAHNSLFLPKGSELVIIRKADYINEYQPPINQLRDLQVTYIDANWSCLVDSRYPFSGPFFMYCTSELAEFAECKHLFPIVDFIKYILGWCSIRRASFLAKIRRRLYGCRKGY